MCVEKQFESVAGPGVSNFDRCYHVYGGITFFEGSAPKIEEKSGPDFLKILYCTPLPRVCYMVARGP